MNLDRFPQKNTTAKFGNAHLPNQRSVDDRKQNQCQTHFY